MHIEGATKWRAVYVVLLGLLLSSCGASKSVLRVQPVAHGAIQATSPADDWLNVRPHQDLEDRIGALSLLQELDASVPKASEPLHNSRSAKGGRGRSSRGPDVAASGSTR